MYSYIPDGALIAIVCVVVYAIVVFVANALNARQLKHMRAERYRLEKVVRDYNRAFDDDYKPF